MISTATAAVNACAALAPASEPAGERQQREHDHDRDEDRGDAVGEPLHRGLAGLGRLDQAGDLRERRIGADLRRAHDQPAVAVERRAGHVAPGATSTGSDSPVSSDWSIAESPSTTTPSVAIFSPGRTTNRSPTWSSETGTRTSCAVAQDARLLRAELEQLPDRLATSGPWRAPRGSGRARPASSRPRRPRSRRRRRAPISTTADHSHAASVPSEISVSIDAAKWRAFFSAAR